MTYAYLVEITFDASLAEGFHRAMLTHRDRFMELV